MRKVFLLLALTVAMATTAWAGPFGTSMGDKPEKFEGAKKVEEKGDEVEYFTEKMPKAHSDLKYYLLRFWQNELAIVCGISGDFKNDSYGTQAVGVFDTLQGQLKQKYGKPKCRKRLSKGSIWQEEKYFAIGIAKNEREHICVWDKNMPDNIEKIQLTINADELHNTTVLLVCLYKNAKNIYEAQKKKDADAL